ncbi:MAG: phosphatidate cytidylyltransferase [Ruminococcus sp.]|nr:phosphatidate cytidylyltransferase [Ruminococcus sp.]
MLTRIISAAVGAVIVVAALILHNTVVFPIFTAAVIAIMLFELLRAVKLHKYIPIVAAVEVCGISMPFIYSFNFDYISFYPSVVKLTEDRHMIAFAVTLLCAFAVFVTWLNKHKEIQYSQVFFALASMVLVPQAMSTIVRIEAASPEHGVFLLVMGLCGAWIADSGAYFTGVAIGKHKLCPEISPKKTIEGFVGGIISTAAVFAAAFFVYNRFITEEPLRLGAVGYVLVAVLGMVCAVIGTVGDLSASMVKRQIGFKDYGKIMPGHGGLMDRFDSVLFVLPTFYAFIKITNIV